MKKIILALVVGLMSLTVSAQSPYTRFGTAPSGDNSGQSVTYSYKAPAYAATYALFANASSTYVRPAPLTGAMTITVGVKPAHVCDEITFMFKGAGVADGGSSASYTVTFSTGFEPATTTLVVDSIQMATATFVFNGALYVEKARARE